MSLSRLREVIAGEWVKCFKESFCSEAGLSHLRERVRVADDLIRLPIHKDYVESRQLVAMWLKIKAASTPQAVVTYLLHQHETCLLGELAPTVVCYQLHAWAQAISSSLKTAIQKKLLTPELNAQIELVLNEQQKKQENKKPFAYAADSYETQIFGRVMIVTKLASSSDVGLFFKPQARQVMEPLISGQHVSPAPTPVMVEVSSSGNSPSSRSQAKPLDPKNEVKRMADRFQGREVFSSERAFKRAKKAFAQGQRVPSLAEKLIRYSVWKQRRAAEPENARLIAAKEMAEQVMKTNLANC